VALVEAARDAFPVLTTLSIEGEALLHIAAEILIRHNKWLESQFQKPEPRPAPKSRLRRF
jgi:hypothetical protein